jgi:hypothetical protein
MKIRVESKDHQIVSLELSGEWRTEPVDLHCLVGPTVSYHFTPDGFYDHAEPRPEARPTPTPGMDVGPADGGACVSSG